MSAGHHFSSNDANNLINAFKGFTDQSLPTLTTGYPYDRSPQSEPAPASFSEDEESRRGHLLLHQAPASQRAATARFPLASRIGHYTDHGNSRRRGRSGELVAGVRR